jgi:Outer membrane protein beta-barrel domain
MKKLLFALLAVGCFSSAMAQDPYSILLYGNLNFSSDNTSYLSTPYNGSYNVKYINWNVSPGVGYQFNDHWTLGLNLSWGQHASDSANTKITQNMYAVGPFGRYSRYFGKSTVFFWYVQADLSYLAGYTSQGGQPSFDKYSGEGIDVYPAVGVNVGHDWCFTAHAGALSYTGYNFNNSSSNRENYGKDNQHIFNFNLWNGVSVGFSKNFKTAHHAVVHHHEGGEEEHRHMNGEEEEDSAKPKHKKKTTQKDEDE